MGIFDLDEAGQKTLAEQARFNPVDVSQVTPSFSTGISKGVGEGIMRGGARAAEFIGMAAAAPVALYDRLAGTENADAMFQAIDDHIHNAVDYWTPTANDVGTAGRILGSLSEMALPLMVSGGNPSLMIGSQEMGGAKDLVSQGASPGAAVAAGTVEGLATAVGFKIPFLGKTLASKLASGAGGNLAVNAGSSAVEQQILKRTGNEAQAEQFSPLNAEARAVDVLTGLAFGGIAHGTRFKPSERDAILTAANAKHFQADTAPGVPADAAASVAHQEAIEMAVKDLLEGKPVDVGQSGVQSERFIPRPAEGPPAEIPQDLQSLDGTSEPTPTRQIPEQLVQIPADEGLSAADQAIESRFRDQIQSDPQAMMDAYAKLPDSAGGKVLNTDTARELSADYLADRTKSAAVHEPASALVKALYAQKLTEAPKPGEAPVVVFTAGGTGAGKTSGLALTGLDARAQIIYDSNMNSLSSASTRIDQALATGKKATILYTYRDPVEALTAGALPRAMRQEAKYGSGRTVPLDKHLETHMGSAETVRQLAEKYKDNPDVDIRVVDNSRGKGKAIVTDLKGVPDLKIGYNDAGGKLNEALDQERSRGSISEAVYRGFKGKEALQPEGIQPAMGARFGEGAQQPHSQASVTGKTAEKPDPLIAAAQQAAVDSLRIPTGEIDADGNVKTISARELMDQAKADIQQAHTDAKAFDAAITCFMSKGTS